MKAIVKRLINSKVIRKTILYSSKKGIEENRGAMTVSDARKWEWKTVDKGF